jgi:hypothetical protein
VTTYFALACPRDRLPIPTGAEIWFNSSNSLGFRTSGYQSGGPSKFTTVNFLYGWDGRPQEFATQLGIGELDVAIAGDDWIRERVLELKYEYRQDVELRRVMSLQARQRAPGRHRQT